MICMIDGVAPRAPIYKQARQQLALFLSSILSYYSALHLPPVCDLGQNCWKNGFNVAEICPAGNSGAQIIGHVYRYDTSHGYKYHGPTPK